MANDETEATSASGSPEGQAAGSMGLIGQLLGGRYRVQSRLGAGGMATVYRAKDESKLNRQVVVKVPHAALLVDDNFRRRFASEVQQLSHLEHPYILAIYDVGEEDGVPFAVTKFLAGGDLKDRCEKSGGTLTPAQVLEWLPQVAETLDFVYSRGRLHRDVSPGNVIFDEHGHPYLSDFGIATVISGEDDPDETAQDLSNLTRPGGFVGAATYAPPESIKRELNRGYDQYSLAVVVYEALCGDVPYARGTPEAVLVSKNTQDPAPLDQKRKDLPPACTTAVMRALSRDPAERFPSAMAFAEAFAAGLETATDPRPTPPPTLDDGGTIAVESPIVLPDRPRRPVSAIVGGAIAVVAGLAAAAWFVTRPAGPTGAGTTTAGGAAGEAVSFTVGSTAEEQAAALELCRQVQGSGCAAEDYADEQIREVVIPPVVLGEHEVTNREFAAFASSAGYRTTAERNGFSFMPVTGGLLAKGTDLSWRAPTSDPGLGYRDRLDHPVVHVSLEDAKAYCESVGGRIPTEEEWEYAAKGSESRRFPWGEDWSEDRAVWRGNSTQPVGSIADSRSWGGLSDMAGNVWEWTTTEVPGDPKQVFVKGGGWASSDPAQLRGSMHMMAAPSDTSADIGFRCVTDG